MSDCWLTRDILSCNKNSLLLNRRLSHPAGDVVSAAHDSSEALRLAGHLYALAGAEGAPSAALRPSVGWWCSTAHYLRALILHAQVCDVLGNAGEAIASHKEAAMLVRPVWLLQCYAWDLLVQDIQLSRQPEIDDGYP